MKLVSQMLSHLRRSPLFWTAIICITLAGLVSRFYAVGQVPHGITWDEAAIGYNGYSVITTRRDEWLQRLPVSFRSYGDYKAPLAIYIVGLSTMLFDVTPVAVRLPFVLAGIFFIASFAFLVKELFSYSPYRKGLIVLGLVFAVTSPWHFHYSRVGFESGMALSFITFSLASFLYVVNRYEHHIFDKRCILFLILSGLSFVASLYTYHSAKIFVPLLLLYLVMTYRKFLLEKKVHSIVVVLICVGILIPLILDSMYGHGAERANVLILNQGLSFDELLLTFSLNFVKHFSLDFLLLGKIDSFRHGIGTWGVLTPLTLLASVVGALSFFNRRAENAKKRVGVALLAVELIILGVLPAALSAEVVPHTNRSLLALPGFLILALVGVEFAITYFSTVNAKVVFRSIIGTVILVECLWFLYISQVYFTTFAAASAPDFQDGYLEAFGIAEEYEKGLNGKPQVGLIEVSSEYGQPYMYALFTKKTSPIYYQGGSLNNYLFMSTIPLQDLEQKNRLIITTPAMDFPISRATHVVKGSDGNPRFLLFYTGQ